MLAEHRSAILYYTTRAAELNRRGRLAEAVAVALRRGRTTVRPVP